MEKNPDPEGSSSAVNAANQQADDLLTLAELEKRHILSTLKQHEGNRTRTAEVLDINIRTLRNKLKEYSDAGMAID
jgi:DNA-binding NtrC family response regulator